MNLNDFCQRRRGSACDELCGTVARGFDQMGAK